MFCTKGMVSFYEIRLVHPSCPNRHHRGFALLLALALLAFAALLVVSLATLARVETAVAFNAQRTAQARQNALLALNLALGRLQRFAGPDRRVTARADLPDAGAALPDGRAYWTGVWDAADVSPAPLTWLVSGNEAQPLAVTPAGAPVDDPAPGNDSVWLLRSPAGAPAQRIKLAARPLRTEDMPGLEGPRVTGRYAWWAGDEGVKAKFNLANAYAAAAPGTQENAFQFMSAQQFGIEQLATGFAGYAAAKGGTTAGAALRDRLVRVLTPNQAVYADSGFTLAAVRGRFHDFTTYSFGVLADTRAGGLRRDLTRGLEAGATAPAGEIFPGGPAWDLVRSYYNLQPALADGRWQIAPRAHAAARHGVHPVALLVQVVWGGERVDEKFRLLFQPMVVLGNPYDVALAPAGYRLVWRQDGVVELRNPPAGDDMAFVAGTPSELLGEAPRFFIPQAGFLPGEAKVFTLPAGSTAYIPGTGVALVDGYAAAGRAFFNLESAAHETAAEIQVSVNADTAGFEMSLDGEVLQEVSGVAAGAPDVTGVMPVLGAPVRAGLRMGHDDINSTTDASGLRWLADFNLRAVQSGELAAWGRNPLYGPATPHGGDDNTVLDGNFAFWGPANRAEDGGRRFVTLFHLPRAELHSLGQLQHANLNPESAGPGCTAGQGYADPHTPDGAEDFNRKLNAALWDRYFFSTLPAGDEAPGNRRMAYYQRAGMPSEAAALRDFNKAAGGLLINGPFNVNSTSVPAWKALLASLNGQQFSYFDAGTNGTNTVTVGSAFPRSPYPHGGSADGWSGFRELSDIELNALAAAIVGRIRAHGPFCSLAEFVNRPLTGGTETARLSGLLQTAIDDVANPPPSLSPAAGLPAAAGPCPALAWPAASQGHRATLAPGWLTQADVLGVLGPVLAVRSDTFLIRAYGDVVNPATGAVESRAWCEAVAQRMPDYVDAANPPEAASGLTPANETYGRRFEIVHFRWLSPEEV